MKITAKKYAISLYEVTENLKAKEVSRAIRNFINLLAKNNAISLGPKIIEEFEKYWWQQQGLAKVELTTARPLTSHQEKKIINQLQRQLKKKIIVDKTVDESLIGGLLIKFNDTLIDGSLRKQLLILKNNLINK